MVVFFSFRFLFRAHFSKSDDEDEMENGEVVVSMTPPSSPPSASVRSSHSSTAIMASTSTLRNKKNSISGSQDSPMDLSLRSFPKMSKSTSKDSHSSDHSQSEYFVCIFIPNARTESSS